jgi:viroplasmin and RNaseH domain-containing protein
VLKNSDKKKILKAGRDKRHYVERNKDKGNSRFLVGNNASKTSMFKVLNKTKKILTIKLEFYTQQKIILQKQRWTDGWTNTLY